MIESKQLLSMKHKELNLSHNETEKCSQNQFFHFPVNKGDGDDRKRYGS